MNIDKPIEEPTIPDLPLGVPPSEVQGDPRGSDGGGGGQRKIMDGTRRGSEPTIPDLPLGVPPSEVQGDPCGGDGGGGGQRDGTRRGMSRRRPEMRARKEEQRGTGHARYAAEEPFIWKINRDGTWRRLRISPASDALASIKIGTWRPWEDPDGASSDIFRTTVSIADPANNNHPVHFSSTDIRMKSRSQRGNNNP